MGALAPTLFLLVPRAAPAADAATLQTQLGLSLSAKGLHRDALAEFERACALDPTNPVPRRNPARAHANLGAHLPPTGAPAEARAAFRAALDVGGEAPTCSVGLGAAALPQRETGGAVAVLEAASRLAPGRPAFGRSSRTGTPTWSWCT